MKKFNVQGELGTLKTVGLFGPPGIESYLAQFYPKKESLFLGRFDLFKGRKEFLNFEKILKKQKIKIINLKKNYAKMLETNLTKKELLNKLHKKIPKANKKILKKLLDDDIKLYGENKAIALNEQLSFKPKIPLGNIYYAHDQVNVLFDTFIIGNMKKKIRKPEIEIIVKTLKKIGYKKFLKITKGTFEGGDAMILKDSIYIGSGSRTSPSAIKQIAKYYKKQNKTTYMIKIPKRKYWRQELLIMHLDLFFMPFNQESALAYKPVVSKCKIVNMLTGKTENFLKHLKKKGIKIINVSKKQQANLFVNSLVTKNNSIIFNQSKKEFNIKMPLNTKKFFANLKSLRTGAGGVHCMTLQLEKTF